jgi:hypothetical protein
MPRDSFNWRKTLICECITVFISICQRWARKSFFCSANCKKDWVSTSEIRKLPMCRMSAKLRHFFSPQFSGLRFMFVARPPCHLASSLKRCVFLSLAENCLCFFFLDFTVRGVSYMIDRINKNIHLRLSASGMCNKTAS